MTKDPFAFEMGDSQDTIYSTQSQSITFRHGSSRLVYNHKILLNGKTKSLATSELIKRLKV